MKRRSPSPRPSPAGRGRGRKSWPPPSASQTPPPSATGEGKDMPSPRPSPAGRGRGRKSWPPPSASQTPPPPAAGEGKDGPSPRPSPRRGEGGRPSLALRARQEGGWIRSARVWIAWPKVSLRGSALGVMQLCGGDWVGAREGTQVRDLAHGCRRKETTQVGNKYSTALDFSSRSTSAASSRVFVASVRYSISLR